MTMKTLMVWGVFFILVSAIYFFDIKGDKLQGIFSLGSAILVLQLIQLIGGK